MVIGTTVRRGRHEEPDKRGEDEDETSTGEAVGKDEMAVEELDEWSGGGGDESSGTSCGEGVERRSCCGAATACVADCALPPL